MTIDLAQQMTGPVWAFLVVFCRLASIIMLFPGIGEVYVQRRVRMLIALPLSLLFSVALADKLPPMPNGTTAILGLLGSEILVGIFFGTLLRVLMATLETTGSVISLLSGFSNAQIFNPALASVGTLPGAMLSITGVLLIFITGLDHVLWRGVMGTYDVFQPAGPLMFADMQQSMIQTVARSFNLGVQLAAPFVVISVLIGLVMGIMAKLMPQLQIFTLALPVQILSGLLLFAVIFSGIMMLWLERFGDDLRALQMV